MRLEKDAELGVVVVAVDKRASRCELLVERALLSVGPLPHLGPPP